MVLLQRLCLLQVATLVTTLSVMVVIRYIQLSSDCVLQRLIAISTSMAFVTSASTAQTGTSVRLATLMLASSIRATASYQSTSHLTIPQCCQDHTAVRLVTTASTATDLFATQETVYNLILRAIGTSALSATIPTFALAAKPALRTHTTELTLSSSSRLLSVMSVLLLWVIMRMESQCQLWAIVVAALHPSLPRPPQLNPQMPQLKSKQLLIFSQRR